MAEGTLVITISNQVAPPLVVSPPLTMEFITGWHVPTKTEMETLYTYLGGVGVAAGSMKETGIIYWNDPNVGATNSCGFSSKGSGYRLDNTGAFSSFRISFNMWSITEGTGGNVGFYYELENQSSSDNITAAWRSPKYGHSIRLIKDDSTDPGTVIDYDGNIYPTVKIGTQVWMAANLATTHYADGTAIPIVTDNAAWAALTTAGMCYYNNTP